MQTRNGNMGSGADTVAGEQQKTETLVVFRVGELRLGIDVRAVREVTRAIPLSAPLSNVEGVLGMITLRGESAAVIDVSVAIGAPRRQVDRQARFIAIDHGGSMVCLLVDGVEGLLEVIDAALEPPPSIFRDVDVPWLMCVTRSAQGDLVGVIDADALLFQVAPTAREAQKASV